MAPIKDNAVDVTYSTKPVESNINPHIIKFSTTVTYVTKDLESNVNFTNQTYKVSSKDFDDAADVTYSSNSIERKNVPSSKTETTTIIKPFTATYTKFPEF